MIFVLVQTQIRRTGGQEVLNVQKFQKDQNTQDALNGIETVQEVLMGKQVQMAEKYQCLVFQESCLELVVAHNNPASDQIIFSRRADEFSRI